MTSMVFPYLDSTSLTSSTDPTLIFSILIICSFVLLALGIILIPKNSSNSLKAHYRTTIDREDQSVEVLSWEPRACIIHNFLSQEECEYLIKLAKPHMKRSKVSDSFNIKGKYSSARTSSGTFLARGQDKTIQSIEKRIAEFTSFPVENGEGIQVIHYEVGQKFDNHTDYFTDKSRIQKWGQRMVTVLMYLSDVEVGGQTVFPSAKRNIRVVPGWNELSESGKKGLSVKPKMGDALLFWSMKPDGSVDPLSLHGGSLVIKGDKWCATKWIHDKEYKAYV